MKVIVGVIIAVWGLGCTAAHDVGLRLPTGLDTRDVRIQLSLVESCSTQRVDQTARNPIRSVEFDAEAMTLPLGEVPEGTYGLFAQAIGPGCRIVAVGCEEVTVTSSGDSPLRVTLSPIDVDVCRSGEVCINDVCSDSSDAGVTDAGSGFDATMDTQPLDVFVGDVRDVGPPADARPADARPADARPADSGPTCACTNPEDRCENWACIQEGPTCDLLTPCTTPGYSCSSSRCRCTDTELCGPLCNTSAECRTGEVCDLSSNRCRRPLRCLSDYGCEAGLICIGGFDDFEGGACEPPGPLPQGAECTRSTECESGFCLGVCVEHCVSNSDCTGELQCRTDSSVSRFVPACLLPIESCESCGDTQMCNLRNGGCETQCEVSGDCPEGQGCFHQGPYRRCRPSPLVCEDFEMQVEFDSSACFTQRSCWLAVPSSCPDGYTCTNVGGFSHPLCRREP